MINKLQSKLALLVLFLSSVSSFSQNYKLSDQAKISVLTCGSGNELYSIYGHTALRIQDTPNHIDVVFNYGTFDFRTENFYLKFIKGDLQYFVSVSNFDDFMSEYIYEDREVKEQNLKISNIQKQKLFDDLLTSLNSDDKFYTYKFIDKNCTTMVLDKVNGLFDGNLIKKKKGIHQSYRSVLYPYLKNHFFENLGINMIFGYRTDAPATRLFLPIELQESLDSTQFEGKPVVGAIVFLNKKKSNSTFFSIWNNFYVFSLFFLILILVKNKLVSLLYFTIFGLLGIFFVWVGFYSLHHEVTQNYNILLFNPSLLMLAYFMVVNRRVWITYLAYFNIVCLLLYVIILYNKIDFLMMSPMIICSGILIYRRISEYNKLLPSVK